MTDKKRNPGGIRKSFGWAFKPFINLTGWFGYHNVKDGFGHVKGTVDDIFATTQTTRTETFAEATERLQLDNAKLHKQYENFQLMFVVSLVIASLLLTLSVYWIYTGGIFGGFFVFLLMLIGLANAYRYHFWMHQIKQKKLGSTFSEWLQATCRKKKEPSVETH